MRYCDFFDCTKIIEWRLSPEIVATAIVLLLCGVVSSRVAIRKGRAGRNWFWLGFFLGPLGVAWAFALAPDRYAAEGKTYKDGTTIRCPYCGKLTRVKNSACRLCDGDLLEWWAKNMEDTP